MEYATIFQHYGLALNNEMGKREITTSFAWCFGGNLDFVIRDS